VSLNAHRPVPRTLAVAAAIGGAAVAWRYHQLGLTLTHYDARGHLVVARRIADSITPGWQQIGAVWLPLPHLLNAVPVQIDRFYRSGASAVAISIVAFAVSTGSVGSIVLTLTGSSAAAVAAAAVLALNPNVLYLQSTPMTEPLLVALATLGVAMLIEWCSAADRNTTADLKVGPTTGERDRHTPAIDDRGPRSRVSTAGLPPSPQAAADHRGLGGSGRDCQAPSHIGWVFALACMTRYEAWPITACALVTAAFALHRRGLPWSTAWTRVSTIGLYPAVAVAGFTIFSRIVIGQWFVSGDFFVPENKARNDLSLSADEIAWGIRALSGALLVWIGAAGTAALAIIGLASRRRSQALVAVSLAATAAIPWIAFYKGHPFRIRYMIPLIAMEAVGAGLIAGLFRRARLIASAIVVGIALLELRPLDRKAPMVVEAQWDRPNQPVRAKVTACLDGPDAPGKIMASMGSLGHYMQEASAQGYAIRNFLHEGNGDIWLAALNNPRPYAEWLLIEEKAEGGDMLARLARERPGFLAGYMRVCEGAGLALYRRQPLNEGHEHSNRRSDR
jgi:hypothetical protein